jgi:hypothetical protein
MSRIDSPPDERADHHRPQRLCSQHLRAARKQLRDERLGGLPDLRDLHQRPPRGHRLGRDWSAVTGPGRIGHVATVAAQSNSRRAARERPRPAQEDGPPMHLRGIAGPGAARDEFGRPDRSSPKILIYTRTATSRSAAECGSRFRGTRAGARGSPESSTSRSRRSASGRDCAGGCVVATASARRDGSSTTSTTRRRGGESISRRSFDRHRH